MEKNVHFIWCDEWMIWYDMIWKHDLFLIDRESEPGGLVSQTTFFSISLCNVIFYWDWRWKTPALRNKTSYYYLDVCLVCCLQLNFAPFFFLFFFLFLYFFSRGLSETRAYIIIRNESFIHLYTMRLSLCFERRRESSDSVLSFNLFGQMWNWARRERMLNYFNQSAWEL